MASDGWELGWTMLESCQPDDVCARALVSFDWAKREYFLRSFGQMIAASLSDKRVFGTSPLRQVLADRVVEALGPAVPWYLAKAQAAPLSGKLIAPADLPGGQIFVKGSHVLPLDALAMRHAADMSGFLRTGREFGGESLAYGDASFRVFPLPRIPVVFIGWAPDDEFAPRVDLFFDSTCSLHLPTDILWSIAGACVSILA